MVLAQAKPPVHATVRLAQLATGLSPSDTRTYDVQPAVDPSSPVARRPTGWSPGPRVSVATPSSVHEASPGMLLEPGQAWIAPGGYHMLIAKEGTRVRIQTNEDPPENSCRPAVDVLLRSVAKVFGPHSLTVILTGMGSDGMHGAEAVVAAGGSCIAQDEASSVVWGMPGAAANAGVCSAVLPLDMIGPKIVRLFAGEKP